MGDSLSVAREKNNYDVFSLQSEFIYATEHYGENLLKSRSMSVAKNAQNCPNEGLKNNYNVGNFLQICFPSGNYILSI